MMMYVTYIIFNIVSYLFYLSVKRGYKIIIISIK